MIAALLQQNTDTQTSFRDNAWLDQYQFHFGEWLKQIVDWSDQNLGWLLDAIIWPFNLLFDLLLSTDETRSSLTTIPWYWIVIAFFIIGSVARNTRVGVMAGVLVAICGLLGPGYWEETVRTFGMIFVSVLICAIIGIPLGVLCGRVDAVWNVARPVLDAMQVVHPFVYMLPFVFFWSVGEESATMATMVFALPPLVRLTNLGVRQVPEDVVEASRSFGATELRVLTDVQLPLARPAIMTGLNQTLLMAVSMLGIAAIMGAGGIGKLLLQAINSFNVPQATSGGLTFFFIAVVLDRISQGESGDGLSLLGRIRESFAYRRDPEGLLAAQAARSVENEAEAIVSAHAEVTERPAPLSSRERMGLIVAAIGSLVAAVSVLLPWGVDAGLVSAWGRRIDEVGLQGRSFAGFEASGGSMFAIAVLGLSGLAFLAAIRPMLSFSNGASISRILNKVQGVMFAAVGLMAIVVWILNMLDQGFGLLLQIGLIATGIALLSIVVDTFVRGTPRLGSDGAAIASIAALGGAVGYFLLQPSAATLQYSHGVGVYLALAGTAVAVVGSVLALTKAPYAPRTPLSLNTRWSLVVGAAVAAFVIFASMIAPWSVDERTDTVITPEVQERIDFLTEEAENDVGKAIANSQEITNIYNSLQGAAVTANGFDDSGPGLGLPTVIFAALAAVGALVASGMTGAGESLRWRAGTIAAGTGLAALVVPASWIFSFTRTAEPRALTGNGAFFAAMGCFILFAMGRGVVAEFNRRKVYSDMASAMTPTIDTTETISAEVDDVVFAAGS